MNLMMYTVCAVCGFMAIKGTITIGGVFLVVQGFQKVMWPVMNMTEQLPKIFTVKDLMKKIEETLQNEDNYEETVAFKDFKEGITLENVDFGYEESDKILENVQLELKKVENISL